MPRRAVTAAKLHELAATAEDLAEQISEVCASLHSDTEEHRRQASFRLEDAAVDCQRVARELHTGATVLSTHPQ